MNNNQLGNFTRRYRKELGIGSRELSRRIGMTDTYVAQLERGAIKKPNYYIAMKLMECLNIPKEASETILGSMGIHPPDPLKLIKKGIREAFTDGILPWLDEEIDVNKKKCERIHSTLLKFIESDYSKAQPVISNLDLLVTNSEIDFVFFCDVISTDLTRLNREQKKEVLEFIHSL